MELKELYAAIGLQPEMIRELESVGRELHTEQYEYYLERMMNYDTAAEAYEGLSRKLGADERHLKMLYCQLECAGRTAEKYRERGIPGRLFADTMGCFPRFLEECRKKNGEMFFDRGWWTWRQISMTLFRIGTLEYEFCEGEEENVIGIHIPSDADLTPASVEDSLERAGFFFRTFYRGYRYEKYRCDSWLLSPVLKTLLPEESNIASFQKRFQIVREDRESKEFIEWLFQKPEDTDYKTLPENTGLQKRAKALLLKGGTVGSAVGEMPAARIRPQN